MATDRIRRRATGPFLKNFRWTTEDRNQVSLMIAEKKTRPRVAAKKRADNHKSVRKEWLP